VEILGGQRIPQWVFPVDYDSIQPIAREGVNGGGVNRIMIFGALFQSCLNMAGNRHFIRRIAIMSDSYKHGVGGPSCHAILTGS
jgi:hypothetical protein